MLLTPRQAAKETAIDYRTLVDGAKRRVLRCDWQPTSRDGKQPMFELAELLEDLAACTCSYPGCSEPAPGKSGRCGKHRARGEPALSLICQNPTCPRNGEPFLRPRSWLREEGKGGERGQYCSNRCKGQATNDAEALRKRSMAGGDKARDHHQRADAEVAKFGVTTATLARETHTSQSVVRASAPGLIGSQVVVLTVDRDGSLQVHPADADVKGTRRLLHPGVDAAERYARAWVRDESYERHRRHYLDPDVMVAQQAALGRLELRVDEVALRDRIEKRRRFFAARRAGASKKDQLRNQLLDIAAEVTGKYVSVTEFLANEILAEIGEVAWERDVADFRSRYPADRFGQFDYQYRHNVIERVRGLVGADVKALQTPTKKS